MGFWSSLFGGKKDDRVEAMKAYAHSVISAYHVAALKGVAPMEHMRMFGESIDIRYANKEEKRIEKDIAKLDKDLEQNLVMAAEKVQDDILRNLLSALKHLYKAVFNIYVFELHEIAELDDFVQRVLKNHKVPVEVRKMLAPDILKTLQMFEKDFDERRKNINAVYANAKGGSSIGLAMTKLLHTSGASSLRRRQEWNLVKDGHKAGIKTLKIEKNILAMHYKSKEAFQKDLAKLDEYYAESAQDYAKAAKLLFAEWEEIDKYFKEVELKIEKAAAEHKLPSKDIAQWHELESFIMEKILEPFMHNLQEANNQVMRKVQEVESEEKQLQKAA